jgi:hypothetical protein
VTFKTYRIAHEIKEIYNKALFDQNADYLDRQEKRLMKFICPKKNQLAEVETSKAKLRNIVLNKLMKDKDGDGKPGSGANFLAKAGNVLIGTRDMIMKSKVAYMKETAGKNVNIYDL